MMIATKHDSGANKRAARVGRSAQRGEEQGARRPRYMPPRSYDPNKGVFEDEKEQWLPEFSAAAASSDFAQSLDNEGEPHAKLWYSNVAVLETVTGVRKSYSWSEEGLARFKTDLLLYEEVTAVPITN